MMVETRAAVWVYRCWGCGRLKIQKPWTPATLPMLNREGRLLWGEYLCSNDDCLAWDIAEPRRKRAVGGETRGR